MVMGGGLIPAPYTGWTFFTFICCKNCNDVCLKRLKMNEKEAAVGPFLKNTILDEIRTVWEGTKGKAQCCHLSI